ncbi:hypothetical protein ABFV80_002966 [Vandammella animalimorsus]|uniref:hypothetical protein n=1 Tax=Vandammella animalimorsus TaxID=2029117 RepID=UPI00325C0E10
MGFIQARGKKNATRDHSKLRLAAHGWALGEGSYSQQKRRCDSCPFLQFSNLASLELASEYAGAQVGRRNGAVRPLGAPIKPIVWRLMHSALRFDNV